jgi:uncharacterized Zn finger protein (UPF0148 family)
MYVECVKCGHGFSTDIVGTVYCPKCGHNNRNEQLTQDQYIAVAKNVERALEGYSRCTSTTLRRNDKNLFERTITLIEKPEITTYSDRFSTVSIRMHEKRIVFEDYVGHKGRYDRTELKTIYSEPGCGVNTIGENSVEAKSFEMVNMTDDEIVSYVDMLFDRACFMGVTKTMNIEVFDAMWERIITREWEVSSFIKEMCEKGEENGKNR